MPSGITISTQSPARMSRRAAASDGTCSFACATAPRKLTILSRALKGRNRITRRQRTASATAKLRAIGSFSNQPICGTTAERGAGSSVAPQILARDGTAGRLRCLCTVTGDRYDVIIIGSGPGGGTMAWKLAQTGKRVLLLERGSYLPRERENWESQAVFVEARYQAKETWHSSTGASFHPGLHYFVG